MGNYWLDILEREDRKIYGQSLITPAERSARQLQLTEDAMIIYRCVRGVWSTHVSISGTGSGPPFNPQI